MMPVPVLRVLGPPGSGERRATMTNPLEVLASPSQACAILVTTGNQK